MVGDTHDTKKLSRYLILFYNKDLCLNFEAIIILDYELIILLRRLELKSSQHKIMKRSLRVRRLCQQVTQNPNLQVLLE